MEALSHVDWLTLGLGIVLGIPVAYVIGILAHMHTPKFVQFLESRKLLKTHKTRQQALRIFNRIKAFRDGTRDKYAYYITLATTSILCGIAASTLILIVVFQNEFPVYWPFGILWLIAVIAILLMLLSLAHLYETVRQLERFDDYKKEIEQRWGPVDEGEPKP